MRTYVNQVSKHVQLLPNCIKSLVVISLSIERLEKETKNLLYKKVQKIRTSTLFFHQEWLKIQEPVQIWHLKYIKEPYAYHVQFS